MAKHSKCLHYCSTEPRGAVSTAERDLSEMFEAFCSRWLRWARLGISKGENLGLQVVRRPVSSGVKPSFPRSSAEMEVFKDLPGLL